jgi:hypothetical protein
MRYTLAQVRAKTEALSKKLAAVLAKDLSAPVDDRLFQDCRRLCQDALEAKPGLERLMPPAFVIRATGARTQPNPTCLELRGYCERILQALTSAP